MNTVAEQPVAVGILHLYSYKCTFVHLMVVHFFYCDLFFTLVVFCKQNSRSFGFGSHRRHMPLPHLGWSTSVTAEWTPPNWIYWQQPMPTGESRTFCITTYRNLSFVCEHCGRWMVLNLGVCRAKSSRSRLTKCPSTAHKIRKCKAT